MPRTFPGGGNFPSPDGGRRWGTGADVAGLGGMDVSAADVDAGRGARPAGAGPPHPPAYPDAALFWCIPAAPIAAVSWDFCLLCQIRCG
jgi:hypothetical protein